MDDSERLSETVQAIVSQNREGRSAFTQQSQTLNSLLLSGTDEELNEFIAGLKPDDDEQHNESN